MKYNQGNMQCAVNALVSGKMSGDVAASMFGVPRSTVYFLAKKLRKENENK